MERKVDIQELSNFLMDYTTSMMGVGVHTARAVRSVSRIAESFGYGIDVTIFQKNITKIFFNFRTIVRIRVFHLNCNMI